MPNFFQRARAWFVDNLFSDRGPENPRLGNRAARSEAPAPATSGMTGTDGEWDYFREPALSGTAPLSTQLDPAISPERVTQSVRMRWNPIRGLTPEGLVSYLDQWQLGFFRMAGMTWDTMERRDYQIRVVAPKRKKAVACHGYDILTVAGIDSPKAGNGRSDERGAGSAKAAETSMALEQLAGEQAAFLTDFWNRISVQTALEPDETGGFGLLVRQMMDAIGKRYAVHEIIWQPSAGGEPSDVSGEQTAGTGPALTAKFIFCPIWWFEGTRGKLRFLDSEFQVYGRDMRPGEWLVTTHDGIMEACSIAFLLKNMPLRLWLTTIEKFGQPGIFGETSAPYGSREWREFVRSVKNYSQEWAAVTNCTNGPSKISLVEPNVARGGENMFNALVEKMDKAITLLWRGADLGTSSRRNAVGASLQEDETEILETDDARVVNETLDAQVTRPALEWRFGAGCPKLAYLKIRAPEEKNIVQDLQIDQFILASGGKLDLAETYEHYGRKIPLPGASVLYSPNIGQPTPGVPRLKPEHDLAVGSDPEQS
jgi:hypothetical protein